MDFPNNHKRRKHSDIVDLDYIRIQIWALYIEMEATNKHWPKGQQFEKTRYF